MTFRRMFVGLLWAGSFVATADSHATPLAWTPIGIGGADVSEMVAEPASAGVIWAASGHRLYRSADGGASWEERMTGLPKPTAAPYFRTIVPDPFQAGTVLLRTSGRGIWRTSDAGMSWTRVLSPAQSGPVLADPSTSGVFHLLGNSLLRSTDHGLTWQTFQPAVVNHFEFAAAVVADPLTQGTYYSLHGSGPGVMEIRVATGYGAASSTRATDVPGFITPGNDPLVLRVAGDADRTLYWSGTDLFRSSDGGMTWQAAGLGRVIDIRVDPLDPAVVYATAPHEIFRTADSGDSWQTIDVEVPGLSGYELSEIEIDPSNTSRLFVGTGRYGLPGAAYGALVSANDGDDWSLSSSGMASESTVCSLTVGETSQTLYAVIGAELFITRGLYSDWRTINATLWRSIDQGDTWIPSSPPSSVPGVYCNVTGVAVDPADNQKVYVSTESDGVFRSTDGGATWTASSSGLTSLETTTLAIAPSDPQVLYVQTGDGLFRSVNAAVAWSLANADSFTTIDVDPFDATLLYADNGYEKSTDAGSTFAVSPAVTTALGSWDTVPQLSLGLSRSTAGRTYLGFYARIAVGLPTPGTFSRRETHRSDDWLDSSMLLDDDWDESFLAVDPLDADVVYSGRGRSDDAGATWRSLVPALPANVCEMAIDADNGSLYAGSRGVEWPATSGLHSLAGVACTANSDCDDGNECTTESCVSGTCLATPVANGTPCMKDFACVPSGSCNNGSCSQVSTGCNDGNACTDDVCAVGDTCGNYAEPGCVPCTTAAECDDGRTCTNDSCSAGKCVNYVTCDDGDSCTVNTCEDDECVFVPVPELCLEEHLLDESVKLTIKPRGADVSLKLKSRSSEIPVVERETVGDPSVQGMSVDVFNADGSITHLDVPAGEGDPGWSIRGDAAKTSYRFRNTEAPDGPSPVFKAQLAGKKLQVQARGGVVLPDASAQRIGIRVTSGNLIFCALMETDEPREGKFQASHAVSTDCSDEALTP